MSRLAACWSGWSACLQAREAALGSLRQELRAGQEEAAAWQRRCKQLQGEADGRELELARRDLLAKVGGLARAWIAWMRWAEMMVLITAGPGL